MAGELNVALHMGLERPGSHNWGWLKRSLDKPTATLGQQIGELLFGLQLEIQDLHAYRLRLSDALQRLQDVEAPFETEVSQVTVPREKRSFQVGSIAWQPPPVRSGEPYCATPRQVFEARRLARVHEFIANEEGGFSHRVNIRVDTGVKKLARGFDEVRFSTCGLEALQSGQDPPVRTLRLPPRFHRQVDLLRCAASA